MRQSYLFILLFIAILPSIAEGRNDRVEWQFINDVNNECVKKYLETGIYNGSVGIKSAELSFRHRDKVVKAQIDREGNPTANSQKNDYWLFEVPVSDIPAGTVVDLFIPFAGAAGENNLFVLEYRDGKNWLPVISVDKDGSNCTSTGNYNHPRRMWQAVRLEKPVKGNGKISFRLRQIEDKHIISSVVQPTPHGEQPQAVIYNNAIACDTTKLLFIGNSYTFFYTYPIIFKEMAWREGHYADCTMFAPPGYTIGDHLDNKYSMELIDTHIYDYVMLQDQSFLPTLYRTEDENEGSKNLATMIKRVRRNSPDAKILLEITWGRRNGNDVMEDYFLEKYPHFYANYDAMQERLIESMTMEAQYNNALLLPVGYAWQFVMHERPDINLYFPDNYHPSYEGSYLIAAVAYLTVYGKPFGADAANCKLDAETAEYLRSVAERVVLKGEVWCK